MERLDPYAGRILDGCILGGIPARITGRPVLTRSAGAAGVGRKEEGERATGANPASAQARRKSSRRRSSSAAATVVMFCWTSRCVSPNRLNICSSRARA